MTCMYWMGFHCSVIVVTRVVSCLPLEKPACPRAHVCCCDNFFPAVEYHCEAPSSHRTYRILPFYANSIPTFISNLGFRQPPPYHQHQALQSVRRSDHDR